MPDVQRISYANKRYGDLWTSQESNEIKSVVNANADILATQQTAISEISDTLDETLEQHVQNSEALRILSESNVPQVFLTQAQYDALVANDTVQSGTLYNIYE